jgi:hypothetical protein
MSSLLVFLENVSLSAGRAHAIYFELGFSHALLEQRFHGAVVLGVLFHEPPFINADLSVKNGTQDRRLRLQIDAKARSSWSRENLKIATTSFWTACSSFLPRSDVSM